MTKIMTASQMTDGQIQIENIVDKFRDALLVHRADISPALAQQIVELCNLGTKCYSPISDYVGMSRRVKVDRTRSRVDVLSAAYRSIYLSEEKRIFEDRLKEDAIFRETVDTMPKGEGDEVEIIFFKLNYEHLYVNDERVEKEYEVRGLRAADPYSLATTNEDRRIFAEERPNCTHWKDFNGNWRHILFGGTILSCPTENVPRPAWGPLPKVAPYGYYGFHWPKGWWFAGIRK